MTRNKKGEEKNKNTWQQGKKKKKRKGLLTMTKYKEICDEQNKNANFYIKS